MSNGYRHQPSNSTLGSGRSDLVTSVPSAYVPRQLSQMIPTTGFNSQQAASANFDCSNGGFSSTESNAVPQPFQQKKYMACQNSHILHNLGTQIGVGMRSNVLHKGSSYGLSNGLPNSAVGLIGSNIELSGPAASDGFQSPTHASSPKPLYQNFDQQHRQSRIPSNISFLLA